MRKKLGLSEEKINKARELAANIVNPVQEYIDQNTTTTVERTALRCLGADLVNEDKIPVPNLIVQQLGDKITEGASKYYINALLKEGLTPTKLNTEIAKGLDITKLELVEKEYIEEKAKELVGNFAAIVKENVRYRNDRLNRFKENQKDPMLYVIVATGNIYEDIKQAESAVEQGADVVAVIRTTAQSLLDYVPFGPTTEGFGGTYATQENFRIMRKALDTAGDKAGRYIRLVNYCSGLCMPEIAAMGAIERLDMMLNDSMYGILFRDINMYRTFVDQKFSRMINSFADIIINTGEDNYLTTSDAFEKGYTVLASQFLNEKFAYNSGMPAKLMGLGHAFEMDPKIKNGFLYEISQAQMAREIFPEHPLKYMPPTKYMTGNIFKGYAMNSLFNFASKMTGQSIHLLGMLTEAIHTPFIQDRYLALESSMYIMNNIADLGDEIEFKDGGIIKTHAEKVLDETIDFLKEIESESLFDAIAKGLFADVKRPKDGGKGINGVYKKGEDYYNPVEDFLIKELFKGGQS
ncbi:MAG: D-lysine 5,6-aminomutase subunit alpha [Candidatus Muiribacterium halophilum]|uniref:D-lysine 5,6-aminomutase subunit alpha n=1 Tax=Muiribacterium halophilum TaxID=2053465 RepID=A0A2N5ZFD7_MUIH1|nr:MAG: D-lysine 5,6-aminomutase subunit alpha [Candidatus Muirbacterium halophilum]